MTRSPRRTLVLFAVGFVLLQGAWILAVPPFRGIDEWDHAYRASAVAHGQWRAEPSTATRGTGATVLVPEDIVGAAREECQRLLYTGPAECVGTSRGDGFVEVASGAGRYNPAFYAVIGYPSLPFTGATALYAMRVMAALASLALLVAALGSMLRWRVDRLSPAMLLIGVTPTVVYTTVVAAPNGVEIVAGLAWACGLIGLARADDDGEDAVFLLTAAAAGVVLMTVRSLGPLWLVLILALVLIAVRGGPGRLGRVLRRPSGIAATGLVVLSGVASVAWTLSQSALTLSTASANDDPALEVVRHVSRLSVLWPFQAIAAFPYRNHMAPPILYAVYVTLALAGLLGALWLARGRLRLALVLGVLASLAVPWVLSVATWRLHGDAWQGRYGLPLGLGVMALAGLALGTAHVALPRVWLAIAGLGWTLAHAVGPLSVLTREVDDLSSADGAWWHPPAVVVMLLVAVGGSLIWWGAVRCWPAADGSPTERLAPRRRRPLNA